MCRYFFSSASAVVGSRSGGIYSAGGINLRQESRISSGRTNCRRSYATGINKAGGEDADGNYINNKAAVSQKKSDNSAENSDATKKKEATATRRRSDAANSDASKKKRLAEATQRFFFRGR